MSSKNNIKVAHHTNRRSIHVRNILPKILAMNITIFGMNKDKGGGSSLDGNKLF